MEQSEVEKQRTYCIYLITNLINGKVYVGRTTNWKKRWREHNYESQRDRKGKRNLHLYNAMRLHGRENFKGDVLCFVDNELAANRLEQYFILEYDSHCPDKGYNMTTGGDGARNLLPESILKISRAASLRWSVPENTPNFRHDIPTEEIIRLYMSSPEISTVAIGKKLGVYPQLVNQRLRKAGVPIRPRKEEIPLAEVIFLYEANNTAEEIAQLVGSNKQRILKELNEAGVKLRRPGARKTTDGREEKKCPKCREAKPLCLFDKNKSSHDGYCAYCKSCRSTKKVIVPEPCSSIEQTQDREAFLLDEDSSWLSQYTSFAPEASAGAGPCAP